MAQPSTRSELIDYCKRKLGAPVLEINVADEQVDDIIDDAVCATPIPGQAPTNLFAYADAGHITMDWVGGGGGLINYNIYRTIEKRRK